MVFDISIAETANSNRVKAFTNQYFELASPNLWFTGLGFDISDQEKVNTNRVTGFANSANGKRETANVKRQSVIGNRQSILSAARS